MVGHTSDDSSSDARHRSRRRHRPRHRHRTHHRRSRRDYHFDSDYDSDGYYRRCRRSPRSPTATHHMSSARGRTRTPPIEHDAAARAVAAALVALEGCGRRERIPCPCQRCKGVVQQFETTVASHCGLHGRYRPPPPHVCQN